MAQKNNVVDIEQPPPLSDVTAIRPSPTGTPAAPTPPSGTATPTTPAASTSMAGAPAADMPTGQAITQAHIFELVRGGAGLLAILVGIGGVGTVLWLASDFISTEPQPSTDLQFQFELARLACRAIISIAAISFAYHVVRVGERLAIPWRLIQDSHVDTIAALLGTQVPRPHFPPQLADLLNKSRKTTNRPNKKKTK